MEPSTKKQKTEPVYIWEITSKSPTLNESDKLPLHVIPLEYSDPSSHGIFDTPYGAMEHLKEILKSSIWEKSFVSISKRTLNTERSEDVFELLFNDQKLVKYGNWKEIKDFVGDAIDPEPSDEEGSDDDKSEYSSSNSGSSSNDEEPLEVEEESNHE